MKLIYGDCIEKMKDIKSGTVDMVLVDPPYGTTNCKWDSVIPFHDMWEQLNRITKERCPTLIFSQMPFTGALWLSNKKDFRYEIIWEKPHATGFLNANKMPMKCHENIFVFYKKLPTYNPIKTSGHKRKTSTRGDIKSELYGKADKTVYYDSTERYPRSVVKFSSDKQKEKLHPTQKPILLLEYLIKTYSNEGDTILDFTMGSGSTGVACANLNRGFIGIDNDKKYFDVAVNRINSTVLDLLIN